MHRGRTPGEDEKGWIKNFKNLQRSEQKELLSILSENRTSNSLLTAIAQNKNRKLRNILDHYLPEETC
jgi:hypothetical protein